VDKVKIIIGILLFVAAAFMWFQVDGMSAQSKKTVELCNQGWGDILGSFGLTQCLKIQLLYYSPWLLGIAGIVAFAKAGPYGGYRGYGGAGSHPRRIYIRKKTKKRLMIIIPVIVVIAVGILLYAKYDITIADQRIDDIIPPESFEKTLDDLSRGIYENIPVKLKERP
jgi:hypothetical protein